MAAEGAPEDETSELLAAIATLAVATGLGWLYAGGFDAAADAPHSKAVYWLLDTARERSIEMRSKDLHAPPLDDDKRIAAGAAEYAAMCAGCHRAPGAKPDKEFLMGLHPQPPDLTQAAGEAPSAARTFWAIKHGIKMSAMPAWGLSHDDDTLWSITASVLKLRGLSAEQYAALTADAAEAHANGHPAPAEPDPARQHVPR